MEFTIDLSANHKIVGANSFYYEKPTEYLFPDRTCRYHHLIYLVKGAWGFTESGTVYHLEKNDVLLIPAGQKLESRIPCEEKTKILCLNISCEPGDAHRKDESLILPGCKHIRHGNRVRELFEAIIAEYWNDHPHKQECMSALLTLLFLELENQAEEIESSEPPLAESLIDLINKYPERNFKLIEVADRFKVSTKTIEAAMKKAVGKTFTQYQLFQKLEMVKHQLLVDPDISLAEVASMFGFCDEFYLSRSFKAQYDISPNQYRKMSREDQK